MRGTPTPPCLGPPRGGTPLLGLLGTVPNIHRVYSETRQKVYDMGDNSEIKRRDPHRSLLAMILQKQIELLDLPLPDKNHRHYNRILTRKILGPVYNCREWFPDEYDLAFAKKCSRAITEMESAGLVEIFGRMTHVEVSESGWNLAQEIEEENEQLARKSRRRIKPTADAGTDFDI
jgi:hypothetical protein